MNDIPKNALVISAHPDDLDFGCCGTVALWTRARAKVTYLICTDGSKGTIDPTLTHEALATIRQHEQRAAAKVVGVKDVIFLDVHDGELENTPILRRQMVEVIRKVRPELVICMDPANRSFENAFVSHRDHREAAEAAFDSMYPACGNSRFFPRLLSIGLEPHSVGEAFFFGTNAPNHWVDISEVMDLKMEALSCHKSQMEDWMSVDAFVRDRFREAGKAKGYEYAETFRRLTIPG